MKTYQEFIAEAKGGAFNHVELSITDSQYGTHKLFRAVHIKGSHENAMVDLGEAKDLDTLLNHIKGWGAKEFRIDGKPVKMSDIKKHLK